MKKTTTYDLGNPCPGLGQAHKCGGLNRVIGIPTLTLLITGSPMTIQIYIKRYNKKNLHQLRMHCVINIAHINSFSL
jgi:hypothetical protein